MNKPCQDRSWNESIFWITKTGQRKDVRTLQTNE